MLNHNVIDKGFKNKIVKGSNILYFVLSESLIPVTVVLSQYKSCTRVLWVQKLVCYVAIARTGVVNDKADCPLLR